jgi:hypothetical protein
MPYNNPPNNLTAEARGSVKKDKLVKQVDHENWNQFVCYCKNIGREVGDVLSDAINMFVAKDKKNKEAKK